MTALEEGLQRYFSNEELRRLAEARVGIAGAGGLGSNVAVILVRSGIRRLRIIDGDTVEPSNLNRQFFWPADVGMPKATALRARLLELEPGLDCEAVAQWLEPGAAPVHFAGCDIVVEALDEAGIKAALCRSLLGSGFFVVGASGIGGSGGAGALPMTIRTLGPSFVCVGDFSTDVASGHLPLAPRVMQAAALQADVVLARLLAV